MTMKKFSTLFRNLTLLLVFAGITLFILESGFRLLESPLGIDNEQIQAMRRFIVHGEHRYFEPNPHTVFNLNRREKDINEVGFWGWSYNPEKQEGVIRIACLGASTTQNGNRQGIPGSYPYLLQQILEDKSEHKIQVMNWGTSGWTSAEMMINYFLNVQDYDPDIVVIHQNVNDVSPRMHPGFRSDYLHYWRTWKDRHDSIFIRALAHFSDIFTYILLKRSDVNDILTYVVRPSDELALRDGKLIPETSAPYRRNIKTIGEHVRLRGGKVVLMTMPYSEEFAKSQPHYKEGIEEHNLIMRELAAEEGFILVDAQMMAKGEWKDYESMFLDLVHVTVEGNRLKAEAVAEAIIDN